MTRHWTSDLHIGHQNIIRLAGRPFSTVDEMNQTIIDNWNRVVTPDDEVMILGDLCMGTIADSLPLVTQLNGTKYLIPGNHDRVHRLMNPKPAKRAVWLQKYRDVGLEIWPNHWWTNVGRFSVDVCHFPFEGDSGDEDRFADLRPANFGQWLMHGHVHEQWKVRDRMINVGVDVWDFTPVSEDQLIAIMEAS